MSSKGSVSDVVLTADERQSEYVGVEHALLGKVQTCLLVELLDARLDLHNEVQRLLVEQVEGEKAGGRGQRGGGAARGQGCAHRRAQAAGAHDPHISSVERPPLTYKTKKYILSLTIYVLPISQQHNIQYLPHLHCCRR